MNDAKCAVEVVKKDKHMEIYEQMESLESAIDNLQLFVDRVSGNNNDGDKSCPSTAPSLSFVLNQTPEAISHQRERVYQLTNELESLLF